MNSPEKEKEWWNKLKKLAAEDDVVGFYREYVKYLEWNSVISESRQAIYKMAIRVTELLGN